jgi:hypothetical protein
LRRNATIANIMRDEEQKLQFLPGMLRVPMKLSPAVCAAEYSTLNSYVPEADGRDDSTFLRASDDYGLCPSLHRFSRQAEIDP